MLNIDFKAIFSFLIAILVFGIGIYFSSDNWLIYYSPVSLFIVVGGTFAATSMSFKLEKIITLAKIGIQRIFTKDRFDYDALIQKLIEFSEVLKTNPQGTADFIKKIDDPFFKEAAEILQNDILNVEELERLLHLRVMSKEELYLENAKKFKAMGQFPPAFGLLGTTIGLIALLSKLGSAATIEVFGPAMSLCMITTMYGIALSNLIINPIAENLLSSTYEQKVKDIIIAEGIIMAYQQKSSLLMAEELNSYLGPAQRVSWSEIKQSLRNKR